MPPRRGAGATAWRGSLGIATGIVVPLLAGGCASDRRGFLWPQGPIAAEDRHIFVVTLLAMLLVFVPIAFGTPWVAWHYRLADRNASYRPKWSFSWLLEFLIWVPPTLIVVGLAIMLWHETHRLDPYRALPSTQPPLRVQVIGLDWKWLFLYPDQHIATVNELVVPAGRTVSLELTSDTVMQSFLVPQLAGQIYAMAGMRTRLHLRADAPGRFRGENTQFNGMGFQNQSFPVFALSHQDFAAWVARTRRLPARLDASTYARLSAKSSLSHPLAFGAVAPDLFRATIARYHAQQPGASARHD